MTSVTHLLGYASADCISPENGDAAFIANFNRMFHFLHHDTVPGLRNFTGVDELIKTVPQDSKARVRRGISQRPATGNVMGTTPQAGIRHRH